jgi:hypothetical protein
VRAQACRCLATTAHDQLVVGHGTADGVAVPNGAHKGRDASAPAAVSAGELDAARLLSWISTSDRNPAGQRPSGRDLPWPGWGSGRVRVVVVAERASDLAKAVPGEPWGALGHDDVGAVDGAQVEFLVEGAEDTCGQVVRRHRPPMDRSRP